MGRGMSKRGTSMQFGPDVTERFCKQNNIDYIIRSHEVKERGWERQHNGRCWTIFSGKISRRLREPFSAILVFGFIIKLLWFLAQRSGNIFDCR